MHLVADDLIVMECTNAELYLTMVDFGHSYKAPPTVVVVRRPSLSVVSNVLVHQLIFMHLELDTNHTFMGLAEVL